MSHSPKRHTTTSDLDRLLTDLPKVWSSFLRDWDRILRSRNHPMTTRYNYILAVSQLARYLAARSVDGDTWAAAQDPTAVEKQHIELFQAWMIDSRSAATALNKHKALQQFLKWLQLDEEEIERSPMDRVKQPRTDELPPVTQGGCYLDRVGDAGMVVGSAWVACQAASYSSGLSQPRSFWMRSVL